MAKQFFRRLADLGVRLFQFVRQQVQLLPFRLGMANFSGFFLAYQPDSQRVFGRHPEYRQLFSRFVAHGRLNQSGDGIRLWSFILNIKQILQEEIPGDFAEVGVWRGNTACILAHFAAAGRRKVFLFDTFEGFHERDLKKADPTGHAAFADTSMEMLHEIIGDARHSCEIVKGYFPDSTTETHRHRQYAVVSVDCDLYAPIRAALEFFYPRMPKGGLFLLHDYSSLWWAGAKPAIDEFCKKHGESVILIPDKSGTALFRKSK